MRNLFKTVLYKFRNLVIYPLYRLLGLLINSRFSDYNHEKYPDTVSQLLLALKYKEIVELGRKLPEINEVGFKAFSQTNEDGILHYIFSLIGTKNKKCVELGCGSGIECNTANLIINHGWNGLLIDGNKDQIREGNSFYRQNSHTYVYPPKLRHAWITKENINNILVENGFEGEIDLLSIDLSGVDYWIWEAIEVIAPRVLVLDYQDILGPNKSLTVPYHETFNGFKTGSTYGFPNYSGASLLAFKKLAEKRGFRLVGTNQYNFAAFYIKNPLGLKEIPEVSIETCFTHPKAIWGMRERFPVIKDLPWQEV